MSLVDKYNKRQKILEELDPTYYQECFSCRKKFIKSLMVPLEHHIFEIEQPYLYVCGICFQTVNLAEKLDQLRIDTPGTYEHIMAHAPLKGDSDSDRTNL